MCGRGNRWEKAWAGILIPWIPVREWRRNIPTDRVNWKRWRHFTCVKYAEKSVWWFLLPKMTTRMGWSVWLCGSGDRRNTDISENSVKVEWNAYRSFWSIRSSVFWRLRKWIYPVPLRFSMIRKWMNWTATGSNLRKSFSPEISCWWMRHLKYIPVST